MMTMTTTNALTVSSLAAEAQSRREQRENDRRASRQKKLQLRREDAAIYIRPRRIIPDRIIFRPRAKPESDISRERAYRLAVGPASASDRRPPDSRRLLRQ